MVLEDFKINEFCNENIGNDDNFYNAMNEFSQCIEQLGIEDCP